MTRLLFAIVLLAAAVAYAYIGAIVDPDGWRWAAMAASVAAGVAIIEARKRGEVA